ncbi:F-box domain [Macleaya cordata]|uniref:F-box domain n=1 Tax=Macleaya cordata TaxID=56857 RepID=A0A200QFH4_MACCD|nr:F-box domain [Macleaya cordata]
MHHQGRNRLFKKQKKIWRRVQKGSMENLLPAEITLDIFSRLPAESVLECKRVCKTWRTLLCDTHFPYMHLERRRQLLKQPDDQYYKHNAGTNIINGGGVVAKEGLGLLFWIQFLDDCRVGLYYGQYDENKIDEQYSYKTLTKINHPLINRPNNSYVMVGSCNGLFCFTEPVYPIDDPVYICNPIAREYVNLPRLDNISMRKYGWHSQNMVCGFGYGPSSNEYKVVRIYFCVDQPMGQVQVYTLGSGSGWRNKGKIPWSLSTFNRRVFDPPASPGILANEALHWMDYKEGKIVAFDLADEEFYVVTQPPCFLPAGYNEYKHCFQLQELGGCLCVVHQVRGERVDIWSLKKTKNSTSNKMNEQEEYLSWTWSREYSIRWEGRYLDSYEPFALTKSGAVLLWWNKSILSRYDPKTETLKMVITELGDMMLLYFEAIPHMNSFVSLKALGERCKTRR